MRKPCLLDCFTTTQGRHVVAATLVLLSTAFWVAACRTSLDADAFIANTLDGRAGEIRSMLRQDLAGEEKVALGRYFAAIEPSMARARQLTVEVRALQSASRGDAGAVAAAHRELVGRARSLEEELSGIAPPPALATPHQEVRAAHSAAASALDQYADALAALDFDRLKPASQNLALALDELRMALDGLAAAAGGYLAPGKKLRLS